MLSQHTTQTINQSEQTIKHKASLQSLELKHNFCYSSWVGSVVGIRVLYAS
jgi:hypothetical protein